MKQMNILLDLQSSAAPGLSNPFRVPFYDKGAVSRYIPAQYSVYTMRHLCDLHLTLRPCESDPDPKDTVSFPRSGQKQPHKQQTVVPWYGHNTKFVINT